MTRQGKKYILSKYNDLCARIRDIENRLEEIRTAGEKITQSISAGGGTPYGNTSKVENAAVKVPELEAELKKCKWRKAKTEAGIKSLKPYQRELIEMIYFGGASQNRAAQILHKTPGAIRATLNNAIDCIPW